MHQRPLEPDTVNTVEGRNSYHDRSILFRRWSGFFVRRRTGCGMMRITVANFKNTEA
jgi:hypothetical protein